MANVFYTANVGVEVVLSMFDSVVALSNLVVLILILRKENLRTVSNLFVAALALSELLVSVVVIPLSIVAYGRQSWQYSGGACVFHGYIFNTLFLTSGTLTTVISMDRFYSLASPMGHVAHLTERTTIWTIVFIVIHSAFWSSFPLFGIGDLKYVFLPTQTRCGKAWTLQGAYGLYYFVMFVASFALPFVVMFIMYVKSFNSARESARKIRPGNIHIQTLQDGQFTSVARQESFDSLKANFTVFIILGSFIVSRGPMMVCDIAAWANGDNYCSPVTDMVVSWMLYLGPLLNPYVYTLLNRRLRNELIQAIKAGFVCCRKKNSNLEEEPKDILDYLRNLTDNAATEVTGTSRSGSTVPSNQTRSSLQSQQGAENDGQHQNGLQHATTNNTTETIQEI